MHGLGTLVICAADEIEMPSVRVVVVGVVIGVALRFKVGSKSDFLDGNAF